MAIPTYFREDGWVKSVLGQAIAGAMVFVLNQPANTVAPVNTKGVPQPFTPNPQQQIYADPFGVTPLTQPVYTDGFGHYDFYVAPGTYTVAIYQGSYSVPFAVYPDQSIGVSSLGGMLPQSIVAVTSQWLNSYDETTGLFTQSQPTVSDILGLANVAITGSYTSLSNTPTLPQGTAPVAHQWFSAYNSSTGLFTQTQPAFSDLSGTLALAQIGATGTPSSSTFLRGDYTWASGVNSLNSLTGALSITAGANITVTPSGTSIQISAAGSSFFTKTTYSSSSRTYNTVYQNTSGYDMLVMVSATLSSSSALEGLIGSTSSPATVVAGQIAIETPAVVSIAFFVPNNYYYKITPTSSVSVVVWTEWVLSNVSGSVTYNNETSSRALSTVYQNTSGSAMLVNISIVPSASSKAIQVISDNNSTPSQVVYNSVTTSNEGYDQILFIVPNNYYYELTVASNDATIGAWYEYVLPFNASWVGTIDLATPVALRAFQQSTTSGAYATLPAAINTTGYDLWVNPSVTSGGTAQLAVSASRQPGLPYEMGAAYTEGAQAACLPILAQIGEFYQVFCATTGGSLNHWIEWTLHP